MVKQRSLLFFAPLLFVVFPPQSSVAETIILNSGEVIEGRIVGQDIQERTITVDVQGRLVTLSLDEIADVKEVREWAGPSTKPMYGGLPRSSPAEQAMDAQLIEEATEQAGSREAASREFMKVGWEYHDQGDLNTAMKRFNQAWLLDPNNADVFWGFGSVSLAHQDADEAIDMFKKALELNPRHAIAMCSLGSAYQLKAYQTRSNDYLKQSAEALRRGAEMDPREEFCYSTWAGTLFLQGEPQEAWEKVRMARRLGGKTLSPDFLKELSAVMPEPPTN